MAEKHTLDAMTPASSSNWYGADNKRMKLENSQTSSSIGTKSSLDPHQPPPSRVVHARAVPDGCSFQEILNTVSRFGKIGYLTMMPKIRQALIEFERVDDAINCVRSTQENQIYILERPVFFNFSTSQEITRSPYGYSPSTQAPPQEDVSVNNILLYTIFNPIYPITVDVIHTISSPCGMVQRVAIFRKNGVQALVEFDSIASAQRAKQHLDGADIYAGCCTLKIEYARCQRVNVYKNDEMTWDYTVQAGIRGGLMNRPAAPPQAAFQQTQPAPPQAFVAQQYPTAAPTPTTGQDYGGMNAFGGPGSGGPGSVLMLYGLDTSRIGCDSIFNLLCSYGNILKVKILVNKPGTAMVHMDNPQAAKNALQHLHQTRLMGNTLQLAFSKHDYIADKGQAECLTDGTPCWKDFTQSRNNRFLTAEAVSKNRIIGPSKILHFYNAPPDSSEDTFKQLYTELKVPLHTNIKFFSQGGKSATGLMEWSDVESALEVYVIANHYTMHALSGRAYTFKLAFSSNTSIDGPNIQH
ncbi:heterogeneous nuclear ribonucleoprotein L-like isoform X2 [Dysidea avara]|uniref:heterogeneous nuclear ribonucleoprotein L-like isoform X2 n=1 Tax=Dysidea avara TaxID=196820 RepID=UPI00331C85C4